MFGRTGLAQFQHIAQHGDAGAVPAARPARPAPRAPKRPRRCSSHPAAAPRRPAPRSSAARRVRPSAQIRPAPRRSVPDPRPAPRRRPGRPLRSSPCAGPGRRCAAGRCSPSKLAAISVPSASGTASSRRAEAASEAPNSTARTPGFSKSGSIGLSAGNMAVPPGSSPSNMAAFSAGNRLQAAEIADMGRLDRRDHRHMGAGEARQRRDLARMVHADLGHAEGRVGAAAGPASAARPNGCCGTPRPPRSCPARTGCGAASPWWWSCRRCRSPRPAGRRTAPARRRRAPAARPACRPPAAASRRLPRRPAGDAPSPRPRRAPARPPHGRGRRHSRPAAPRTDRRAAACACRWRRRSRENGARSRPPGRGQQLGRGP